MLPPMPDPLPKSSTAFDDPDSVVDYPYISYEAFWFSIPLAPTKLVLELCFVIIFAYSTSKLY